jgi:hypothetical protein
MKKVLLLLCVLLPALPMWGQDYIYTKDSLKITADILNVSDTKVIYTHFVETDTVRHILTKKINYILFKNGVKFIYDENGKKIEEEKTQADATAFQFGCGAGIASGMLGLQAQIPVVGSEKLNFHIGAGQFFGEIYTAGIKIYTEEKKYYRDIMVSLIFFENKPSAEKKSKSLGFVFSLMWGLDYVIIGNQNNGIGINLAGGGALAIGSSAAYPVPMFDIGLFYRL